MHLPQISPLTLIRKEQLDEDLQVVASEPYCNAKTVSLSFSLTPNKIMENMYIKNTADAGNLK